MELPQQPQTSEPPDPHDRRLILACLQLTPEQRLLRLEHLEEPSVLIRPARPEETRQP